ncbi:zinc finger and SCAN domain-containing protein 2-like isoform X4 [Anguilla anguilla]|uniref:zinc finger and SCAN domain-containing protein 2-like isoform X4 n=1 Tax=Anguilla anguilla TaxID=7936 RepID=UPI0015B16A58|nr:zinc finger and SCAN domain-containing protein 2-like isoform X4 [Anguilla anguilla]
MANAVNQNFHSQLRSVVDILAITAVKEISNLVDDGFAILHLEISRSQKENEALKCKIQTMELQMARGCEQELGLREQLVKCRCGGVQNEENSFKTTNGVFAERMDMPKMDAERPSRHENTPALTADVRTECANVEEESTKLVLVKEETVEEVRDPQGEMNTRQDRAVEWRAGSREKRPVEETQNKAANHTEELTEQHRTRRAVWEVSGLESVLKAEGQSECVETLQHRGAEHRAGGLNSLDSEFVMFERPGQLGSYCTQGGAVTETEDPCCSYSAEMDPEGLLGPFTEGQDRSGCDMNFSTSDSVQTHLGDIAGKKPIVCKYCGRGFARRNALEIHQRVHTGEKPFSCLQCGKQFAHSGNLKVHQSVHTGERRFRCALCGKRFISSSHLKRHWSVHTRERPFSCAQCGKRFSDAGSRKRHQSVHTGRTAFACAPCGRRFASSGHLRRHRLQVHVPDGAVEDPWPQGENEPL